MMDTMFSGSIYKITNIVNGMFYIGQTVQPIHIRFGNHCNGKSHCKYLNNAIKLYGRNNFTIEILKNIKMNNKSELKILLNQEEIKFIKEFNCVAPNGYNLTFGGDCPKFSQESILANAKKHKKPIKCNETGEEWPSIKECAESFGVRSETIHRVLRGVRDYFHDMSFSYINPERSKPRKKREKKIRSLDSYDLSGLYNRIEKQKRSIKCNETGQTWNSIQSAADFFNVKNESIHRVIRGVRKSFRGLTFSYI